MTQRMLNWSSTVRIGLALAFLIQLSLAGQGEQLGASKNWTPGRTAWGDPDLEGLYTTDEMVAVPLERPVELAGKAMLSAEQTLARVTGNMNQRARGDVSTWKTASCNYGQEWRDSAPENRNGRYEYSRQTSVITDPANGRLPPMVPEAESRARADRADAARRRAHPESWRDFGSWDRCITRGLPYTDGAAYNNGLQIVQGQGYVVILKEMIHEARVIPVDNRPHIGQKITQVLGDPRGHWEGDTLVVEVTNFSGTGPSPTNNKNVRLVERFRLTGPKTLEYRFTVENPTVWTRPWSGMITATRDDNQYELVEYACHEGNGAIVGILGATRAEEKKSTHH